MKKSKLDSRITDIALRINGKDVYNIVHRLLPKEIRYDFKIDNIKARYDSATSSQYVPWEISLSRKEKK